MRFKSIKINYLGVYLETISFDSENDLEYYQKTLREENNFQQNVMFNIIDIFGKRELTINFKKYYVFFLGNIKKLITDLLSEKSLKIIRYLNIFESLINNNFSIVDDHFIKSNKVKFINYIEIIAERNYYILNSLFFNYVNEENYLVSHMLLRDLIENIKLYLYFIRGSKKEELTIYSDGTKILRELNNQKEKEQILKNLSEENKDWDFDVKEILKNNPSLNIWNKELININRINNICNRIIHKNGFTKISPRYIMQHSITLDDIFEVSKFFFTLIVCYDGKGISSSDYIDYLDMGLTPPEGSQIWVASIYQDFIDKEYSKTEKEKLIEQSYMEIR